MMTKREAIKAGKERGRSAAAWKFDGNTSHETYARFLKGWRDGDPAVMDAYAPPSWLSGEWAGESMNELLGECENARDEERLDDVAGAYEQAADDAYWTELERTARAHMIERRDVAVNRIPHSGAIECATVVDGRRRHSTYYDYSARDAVRLFLAEINLED